MRKIINWNFIQNEYDSGLSYNDLSIKYRISQATINRAKKKGLFKPRSMSDGTKLYRKRNSNRIKHTEETKKKISKIRIKYLKENPDKVPYLLNHYSKGDSYPEKYFKEVFEKENIPLKFHKQVGIYELDFYNEEFNIVLEIDGDQHYLDERIVESDIRRTEYLKSLGWEIYRIKWSDYQKKTFEEKKIIVNEIKSLVK